MEKMEIERVAFWQLCGERDKKLLSGRAKMTFSDFERLNYIIEVIGLKRYNLEFWNTYARQFGKQFQQLEKLYDETCCIVPYDFSEMDEYLRRQWVRDFCEQVSDPQKRKQLENIVEQLYMEKDFGQDWT